jgi:hypothetical protein
VDDAAEVTVLQLPKFKAEATELIGTDGIEELGVYLIDHPDAGDVIQGSGGVRITAMGSEGQGEAWRRPDHLPACRDCRSHLSDPVLPQEHEDRSDRG